MLIVVYIGMIVRLNTWSRCWSPLVTMRSG